MVSVYFQLQFSLPHLQLYIGGLVFLLSPPSGGHFSCWSIVSTDEVLWYLFVTYIADLLCIISSLFMSFCRCPILGLHTQFACVLLFLFVYFHYLKKQTCVLFDVLNKL